MREGSFMKIKDNFKEECAYILRLIGALYLVEEGLRAREASVDKVLAERQSRSIPLLAELHKYLLIKQRNCTPKKRKSHDKKNSFPIDSKYNSLISKIETFNKQKKK